MTANTYRVYAEDWSTLIGQWTHRPPQDAMTEGRHMVVDIGYNRNPPAEPLRYAYDIRADGRPARTYKNLDLVAALPAPDGGEE